jgi:uncharacterized protein YcbX
MATVRVALDSGTLLVEAPGADRLSVPRDAAGPRRTALVWDDTVTVEHAGEEAARWFSAVLGTPVELVRIADDAVRGVDPRFGRAADQVGLADGYPLLLLSEASLDGLNRRLPTPVPMDRFRPNLVVSGCPAHAEDGWAALRIGGITLRPVKPCARCTITTVDQTSGVRGAEPLRTLAGYRRLDGKVVFGQNVVHDGRGEIRAGDPCEVVTPPTW